MSNGTEPLSPERLAEIHDLVGLAPRVYGVVMQELLAEVERLRGVESYASKLVAKWRDEAGDNAILATKDVADPIRLRLSARTAALSDCASELQAVLDGHDPDDWDNDVTDEAATTEAGAR